MTNKIRHMQNMFNYTKLYHVCSLIKLQNAGFLGTGFALLGHRISRHLLILAQSTQIWENDCNSSRVLTGGGGVGSVNLSWTK